MDIGAVEKINCEIMRCKDRLKYLRTRASSDSAPRPVRRSSPPSIRPYSNSTFPSSAPRPVRSFSPPSRALESVSYQANGGGGLVEWTPQFMAAKFNGKAYCNMCGLRTDDNGVYETLKPYIIEELRKKSPNGFEVLSDSLDFGNRLSVSFDDEAGNPVSYIMHTWSKPRIVKYGGNSLTWFAGSLSVIYRDQRYPYMHALSLSNRISESKQLNLRMAAPPEEFSVHDDTDNIYLTFEFAFNRREVYIVRKDYVVGCIPIRE